VARVTSKLQVTIPKAIAERYGITPGTDVDWLPAGDAIRVVPAASVRNVRDAERRLRLFDAATERQRVRQEGRVPADRGERGWRREDLYGRGLAG
jgi:AbrB family looped-hinge helix DNA binding protein